MKHPSLYLDWYVRSPHVRYDFRSSGIAYFRLDFDMGEFDLSANYQHGNPETARVLAQMYHVRPENVFISSEGASGQNARIIRCLAERDERKTEAIVEYPTYEPLLRQVEEHFPKVKRLKRSEKEAYRLDVGELRKITSDKTGLLVLTNPHAPSGAITGKSQLKELTAVANEHGFHVLCDEIYAEFNRGIVPTVFSVDSEYGIVTTSFTKAYGLGGLKLGLALAKRQLVDELYADVLNTVGNSPNMVQAVAAKLLTKNMEALEKHKQKWMPIKKETEKWLEHKGFKYFPSKAGVAYWVRLPVRDTYSWMNEHAIPHCSLAAIPGAFFLFKKGYKLAESNMIRLGLGAICPESPDLVAAFEVLDKAISTWA